MKTISKNLCFILLVLISFIASAQNKETEVGDVYYDYSQFGDAIKSYEKALQKYPDKNLPYLYRQLAHAYQFSFKYVQAESCYARLISNQASLSNIDYLDYGIMLKLNGKYEEAKKQIGKYQELTGGGESFGTLQMNSVEWAIKNKDVVFPVITTLTNLEMNGQSCGYSLFEDGIIYSHHRMKSNKQSIPFFDLDYAVMADSIHFSRGVPVLKNISFETNEGSPSFNKSTGLLYFNANATKVKNGKVRNTGGIEIDEEGVSNFNIYVSEYVNGEFGKVNLLPFNNKNYNCIQPFIVEDGNTLYFVSDMPGGKGGLDIYMAKRNSMGSWDKPVNLDGINTSSNEQFPFVLKNRMFFSSKGFNGYGGYDIYTSVLTTNGMPVNPQNMGLPINSFRDDLAFITYANGRLGYFSSNRDNDEGQDNMYFFHDLTLDSIPIAPQEIAVIKTDSVKADPTIVAKETSQEIVKKETPEKEFETKEIIRRPERPAEQIRIVKSTRTAEMDSVEEVLMSKKFKHVTFKVNDIQIIGDNHDALDSLVSLMRLTPNLKIQIYAHADSRGTDEYNMVLSVKRAMSVKKYILAKGVSQVRIITAGFGESRLLNKCCDGVDCTESEHAVNRRVEVRLVR